MGGLRPRAIRYGLTGFVLFWAAVAQLSVAVFIYQLAQQAFPGLPTVTPTSVVTAVTDPMIVGGFALFFLASATAGRLRYGSLAAFALAVVKRTDDLFGYSLFDHPLLIGRIRHDGVAWRLQYWEDGRVEVLTRECPFCGLELEEAYLPRSVVFGENTAFEPGTQAREAEAGAWKDVYRTEKADDQGEVLALTCPQCNVSVPGSKDVLEGREGARAKFQGHVTRMKSANPVDDPFGSYADSVRESADGEPTPEAVWDEYAGNHDADDVLCLGTDPSLVGTVSLVDQSRPSETDTPSVTESHAATIRDEATVERGEK